MSLAVAPVLCELLAADSAEVRQEQFDRIALLLRRLSLETQLEEGAELYSAAFGKGRLAALWGSESNVVWQALQKSADELTTTDTHSMMCMAAATDSPLDYVLPRMGKKTTGMSILEYFDGWISVLPLCP